jgi:hypothetical protein
MRTFAEIDARSERSTRSLEMRILDVMAPQERHEHLIAYVLFIGALKIPGRTKLLKRTLDGLGVGRVDLDA